MTESKQIQQILLSKESEECDMLLDKGELLHKESTYDLKKIPGVSTPGSNELDTLPVELSEGLKEIVNSPRPTQEDNDVDNFASPRGQEGYLPATLRAAISVANKPQTEEDQDRINDLCASPPLAKRASPLLEKRKKKTRTIRRTKSDKTRVLTATDLDLDLEEDNLTKSLHIKPIDSSEQDLERSCKSEELRKIVNRKSDPRRRKSASLHERRPTRSRRDKGKSRRSNPNKDTALKEPSKSPSARRSKPPRSRSKNTVSKSLDTTEVDNQVVDWKRTSSKQPEQPLKPSEQQLSRSKRKPKKSRSTGSNAAAKARRPRRSRSRQTRSLSTSRKSRSGKSGKSLTLSVGSTKGSRGAVDRKGPSPRQLQRKRTQKQKQAEAEKHKPRPLKATESTDDGTQKPRSRRTLMLTSKATTPSCRNLLRKISQMNDDRISKENESKNDLNKPEPIDETPELPNSEPIDEKPEPIDELSRSTLSTSHSTTQSLAELEASIHSVYSSTKPREERRKIHITTQTELEETSQSACSVIKTKEERPNIPEPEDRDEKKEKPPRTKSAPLRDMLKGKAKLSKSSSNNSLTLLSLKSDKPETPPKRSMKKFGHKSFAAFGNKSFSEQFQKFGHKSLSDQLHKFGKMLDVKGSGKSRKGEDDTTRTGNRSKDKQDERKSLERSRSDSSLGLPKTKPNKKKRSSTSQYDLMLSMHSTEEDYKDYECDSDSDDDNSFSGFDVSDYNESLKVPEASKSVTTSPTIDPDDKEGESRDKVINFKDIKPIEKTKKKGGNKKLSEHVTANNSEECDDILSMAEFSANTQLMSGPQKPQSCLQIDFSQFSEHGTPVVKSKKLAKRLNKSSRDGRATVRTPAVKV